MTVDDSSTTAGAGGCDDLLLQNQLCFSLYSTSLMMTKVYKPLLQELNLTYPQYLAMLVLWENDGLTVGEVSTRLLTDTGSLTPLLKRLEVEGMIRRTRSQEDQRVVHLQLTQEGKALHEKAKSVPHCILAASGISLEKLQHMQKDLLHLRRNLHNSF
jgi:DNA-binding MarR family transcriptional regulator